MRSNPSVFGLSRDLARYAVSFSLDQTPCEVIDYAQYLILDLLGAALAGVATPEAKAAQNAVRMLAGQGPCTLWGTPHHTTAGGAALANGICAHARELDDFGGVDHTGAVVIPALGALAQFLLGLTGKAFLESMIIGYEVGRRVLDACGGYRPHNHEDGFHSTGTIGSFAAAAAAARAMNLDEDQTVWAMGLAGSFTGGTWAFARDGAMGKRFHAGWAAETGVTAAVLASQGFTGPEFIFEAEWGGFFSTYARSASCPEKLVQDLGTTFAIMRTGIKPYAACRDIHSSLDVVLRARDKHRLLPEDIQEILVRATPETFQMVGQNPYPETRPQAQLSLSYSLAAAMVTGRAFVEEFEEAMIENFDVQEMARRVRVVEDKGLPFDSEPHIRILTRAGHTFAGHVAQASGSHLNPLAPDKIIEKFDSLTHPLLPGHAGRALKAAVFSIDKLPDAGRLFSLLEI